jgi:hypothetical protein
VIAGSPGLRPARRVMRMGNEALGDGNGAPARHRLGVPLD